MAQVTCRHIQFFQLSIRARDRPCGTVCGTNMVGAVLHYPAGARFSRTLQATGWELPLSRAGVNITAMSITGAKSLTLTALLPAMSMNDALTAPSSDEGFCSAAEPSGTFVPFATSEWR